MNNELRRDIFGRCWLLAILLITGCAQLEVPPEPAPAPAPVAPPPEPVVTKPAETLPPLDVVMIEHHHQCEVPGSSTISSDMPQLHDLMRWLKHSCGISDTTLAPQVAALKKLRQRYSWPEAYAAWLDEWRRQLGRMQMLQQRAAAAEESQATIVERLRAIERDLTTRP